MPIEIRDLDAGKGNVLMGSGIFTGKEYIDALKKHLEQDKEKFKKYVYSITDLTAVMQAEGFETGVVHTSVNLCKQAAEINPTAVVAIVTDKDFLFGLSRMWEIMMHETDWDIKVFKTRDAAERWIRVKVKDKFGVEDLAIK